MNDETNQLLTDIVEEHGLKAIDRWWEHLPPNYNTAPTQNVPVAAERDGQRLVESVRWGMVPPYARELLGSRRSTLG